MLSEEDERRREEEMEEGREKELKEGGEEEMEERAGKTDREAEQCTYAHVPPTPPSHIDESTHTHTHKGR